MDFSPSFNFRNTSNNDSCARKSIKCIHLCLGVLAVFCWVECRVSRMVPKSAHGGFAIDTKQLIPALAYLMA